MQPEKDPIQFTRLLTENRISNERHNRELAELHDGWRMREAELLAHIERLESNQIPEGYVAVPREPTYEMMRAGCSIEGSCERSGECHGDCHCNSTLRDIYRAMIQAATHGEGE